jgi:hypothetical protein
MSDDTAKWSAVVAIAILVIIGAIAMTSVIRYDVADAMTVLDWLGPLIGVVTGAFVGYFFTRGQVQTAKDLADMSTQQANQSMAAADSAMETASRAQEQSAKLSKVVTKVTGKLDPKEFETMLASDSALREALE